MKNYYRNSLTFLAAFLFAAMGFSQDYSDGIFILNEGLIGTETSSVSHINTNGTIQNDIFTTQNPGMTLGDTGQGMGLTEDFAYVVVNNSNEVKVIDRTTFEFVASITDQIVSPRFIAFYNGYGYVTNWGDPVDTTDDYVAIIDLATNTVTGTIPVAEGPEEIIEKDGKLFIAHQGGYGFGNTVSIIDTVTNDVESIVVGDVPSALKIDNDYLYVLCSGKPDYSGNETSGKIVKVNLNDYINTIEYNFDGMQHPQFLGLDNTDLYYVLKANIYKMALTDTSLPTAPFINTTPNNVQLPYGFNKIDDKLYLADGIDYVSNGKIYVYGEDGSSVADYAVGPLPNRFYKYEDQTASVSDFAAATISLYPNPASGSFNLNISEKAVIAMYDLSGRLIKTAEYNNEAVSLAGLRTGVYLVQIKVNNKTTTQKLIIQ